MLPTRDAGGTRAPHYFLLPALRFPSPSLMTYHVPAPGSTSLRSRLSAVYNRLEIELMALVKRVSAAPGKFEAERFAPKAQL